IADDLKKYDTIDAIQLDDLMSRRPVREQGEYGDHYKPKDTGMVIAPVVHNEDELEIADDSSLKEDL
ncbi:ATP-dependent metalloprotease, partial [Francisella tularensis subsp. holarctica]|nr:ATP-dependent metalloprotease [Francisella tularensis subsp. holarctica]